MRKVHRVVKWLPACIIPLGVFWLFSVPTIGKAGLVLAVVATIMPLAWEKSTPCLQSLWFATVFLMFAVEYKAINKTDYDNGVKQASLLKMERDSFRAILSQGQTNFQNGLTQERTDFEKMMDGFAAGQKVERQQFSALLKKEDDLFTRQEQLAESLNGRLIPALEPTPPYNCGPFGVGKDSVVVFLGEAKDRNVIIVTHFPRTIVAIKGLGPAITLDRSSDGSSATVLMDIRGADRKLIARLNRDGFVVNRNNFLEMKKDNSSLTIVDEYGTEVLSVRYLNAHAFIINAVLDSPTLGPVSLTRRNMTGVCLSNAGNIDMLID